MTEECLRSNRPLPFSRSRLHGSGDAGRKLEVQYQTVLATAILPEINGAPIYEVIAMITTRRARSRIFTWDLGTTRECYTAGGGQSDIPFLTDPTHTFCSFPAFLSNLLNPFRAVNHKKRTNETPNPPSPSRLAKPHSNQSLFDQAPASPWHSTNAPRLWASLGVLGIRPSIKAFFCNLVSLVS